MGGYARHEILFLFPPILHFLYTPPMRPILKPLSILPAALALGLLALFMAPLSFGGIPLAPNVVWLVTLVMATRAPETWGRGLAFGLGLLQDVLFGTPLGSQALVTLLLTVLVGLRAQHRVMPHFTSRWLEATVALTLAHALLWCILALVLPETPPLSMLVYGTLAGALWFTLFDGLFGRFAR